VDYEIATDAVDSEKKSIVQELEHPKFPEINQAVCTARRDKHRLEAGKVAVDILESKGYSFAKDRFMNKFQLAQGFGVSTDLSKFNANQIEFYNKFTSFDEKQLVIPMSDVARIKFVYIPSGGGKSTLKRISRFKSHYVDVDELIADRYEEFQMVEYIVSTGHDKWLMNKFFKYLVYISLYKLYDKVVLMNHPNQIPNVFRLGFNELIIIPIHQNWNLRHFNDNFISLLSVLDKVKVISSYASYEGTIGRYFGIHLT